ncbi:ABC transporter substrate-binding protein [Geodermatophilus ruber]|uniref:NitT/TauT family transport system substrate-binding protein n=1 Tax=Geodermatophilus ruber TaxID=504800 RepID=A0A1I4HSR5_9ACTN|nr:ABC transporter substrate-binding protein [Geodermatophilus ruber]SFL44631.1 NitT/TauT family transport system substrate-binding protein [Geodermatophilus ruber]
MTRRTARPAGRRSGWQAAFAAATVATMLAACGGGEDAEAGSGGGGGASGGGELQPVTFLNILPLESLTFTPELVADACGYFEEQGLDVTFETTQGSAQAIQTVIAGSALITRVGDMETMLAIGERDAPLVNVGQIFKTGTIRFVSAESDPLESPEDIEGRLMGTPSEGGTSEIILKLAAASAGIAPEDVQTQVVGLAPGVFDLVTSGRIGGYIVSLDTAVALEQQQPEAVVYAPSEDVESGGQVYITSQEQADDPEKQEQLRAYLAAIREAVLFVAEDEANDFAETIECLSDYGIPTLEDPEVARGALTQYVESWTAAGEEEIARTVPEQWQTVYDEMSGSGFVPEGLDPAEWYTNDFAPAP